MLERRGMSPAALAGRPPGAPGGDTLTARRARRYNPTRGRRVGPADEACGSAPAPPRSPLPPRSDEETHPMTHRLRPRLFAALLLALVAAPLEAQEWPRTWQEQNEFRAGPTPFEPLMEFWHELARLSPQVGIRPLTMTLLDRPFTLVTVSSDPILTPQDAIRSGKTIVLIANSVHGNETSGKEASQILARDLVAGDLRRILDDVVVLFVPILNPDGGEVRRRTNEEGFDMNRDYLKLESQEIHALVTKVMNEWTPDIHVDTHHGGAVPYTLTWQGTLNPAADAELRAYPYQHIFPRMRQALRANGYDGFDYSGPQTVEGVPAWGSTSVEPRKHHVYTGLVNSIGILFETPAGTHRLRNDGRTLEEVPEQERYYHQVNGQVLGMRAVLEVAAERRNEIRALTTASRLRAIRNGATYDAADQVVLDYRLVSRGREEVWVRDEGTPLGYRPEQREVFLKYEPTRTTSRPLGYVLPPSMARVLPLLRDHGITVQRFTRPTELELEVYHATEVRDTEYFQGHYLKAVTATKSTETVQVPAGAYYVPTAQSRGNLIAYLMEPETDDNLITWGFANHLLRVGEGAAGQWPGQAQAQEQQRGQRVPMMRLVREQPLPLLEVVPFNEHSRTRYYQTW
jgi:dipeptidyl-peptidase 4